MPEVDGVLVRVGTRSEAEMAALRKDALAHRLVLEAMEPEVRALRKRLQDAMTFGKSRNTAGAWEPFDVVLEQYERVLLGQLERELLHPLVRYALEQPGVGLVGIIPAGMGVRGGVPGGR